MRFYNTKAKMVEEFVPFNDNEVTLYTCGPTVYSYAHIGNLRTYISEDILEKTLNYLGYNVKRVMNITDVGHLASDADTGDDKMVTSAKKEKKSVLDIAAFYTDAFFKDCELLNIKRPEIISPATENIDEFIKIIEKLIKDEYAYIVGGNVYFDTSKLDNYSVLTAQSGEDLLVGVRDDVDTDENKKNKTDFVLWFTKSKFDDQELKWESPFGLGYPGWHIECSGISIKYLGEHLDIHCGGVDNIFPHHTNEIAQSEAYLGHNWCNYWFHAEFLNDGTGKMSKSKGDSLILNTLISKGYNPLSYRFMCLNSHYRNQLMFTFEALEGAEVAYNKLKEKVLKLNAVGNINEEEFNKYDNEFKNTISDNLNTASTITLIYDLLKSNVDDKTKYELLTKWDEVLGLDLIKEKAIDKELVKKIEEAIERRNIAKENKNYAEADKIREELLQDGIILEDSREGTTYKIGG